MKLRTAFAIVTMFCMLLLTGCMGEQNMVNQVKYPEAPPDYPMFDTANMNNEQEWHISNVHDPSILKEGDTYYLYSTDVKVGGPAAAGIMVRKSKDLIHWDWVGYALDGVPKEAAAWTGATNLWAPDIKKIGDTFYLYYAASTFGSNRSFIGVETSASPEGPWTDQGVVIQTGEGDEPNAIDPNIVTDSDGSLWFVYGSFFGGIYTAPLDPATGKLKEQGFGTKIAARDSRTEAGAVEAPYVIYDPSFKKYYLFVSFDSLSQDYNVRVGRSDSITGPYLDMNGNSLLDTAYQPQFEVGNKLIGGYRFDEGEGWVAPGHNSVLQTGDATYLIHHARPESDPNWMYLHVRKMLWTKDGWPVVSPERFAGEQVQKLPESVLPGDWETVVQEKYIDGQVTSERMTLQAEGKLDLSDGQGKWTFDGDHTVTLDWPAVNDQPAQTIDVQVLASWDWELGKQTLIFTGLNAKGESVWGKKLTSK